jgi:hypothetical protein
MRARPGRNDRSWHRNRHFGPGHKPVGDFWPYTDKPRAANGWRFHGWKGDRSYRPTYLHGRSWVPCGRSSEPGGTWAALNATRHSGRCSISRDGARECSAQDDRYARPRAKGSPMRSPVVWWLRHGVRSSEEAWLRALQVRRHSRDPVAKESMARARAIRGLDSTPRAPGSRLPGQRGY